MTCQEPVEQALYGGWIDDIAIGTDAASYHQRISPRGTFGALSRVGVERIMRPIADGPIGTLER